MGFDLAEWGSGLVNQGVSAVLGHQVNQRNKGENMKQMLFQERMASTAHQREVQDLVAAGLNPNLSAGGAGAPSPSGSSATMQMPEINMPDMLAYGVSVKQLEQAQQRLEIDSKKADADIAKSMSETDLKKLEKIMKQKGMPNAVWQGEAGKALQKVFEWMKKNVRQPTIPKGGEFDPWSPSHTDLNQFK